MKYITFTVPCYNSQDYMRRCIDSLLVGGEDVEIIIVNDGSKDDTLKIAKEYKKQYPKIVKVIDKENGGHGSGVNAGIKNATGKYFKVVDSDDWADKKSLKELLKKIKKYEKKKKEIDLFIVNYTYNHLYENKQRPMRYTNVFPEDKIVTWNDLGKFKVSQYLLMHTLVYRTDILRECNVELPEHTFYVDNIFAYKPLPYIKNMCYLNLDFYQYFIGREDQSVNEKVMIGRIDQQIKITKIILSCYDLEEIKKKSIKLYKYMFNLISMMMSICSIYLIMAGDKKSLEKRKELWDYVKELDSNLYKKLKFRSLAATTYLPTKLGNIITVLGYKVVKRIYKFN